MVRKTDEAKSHVMFPRLDPNDTHSLGIKPHPHSNSIAKQLLHNASATTKVIGLDDVVDISSGDVKFQIIPKHDKRPLIDRLHEATFTDPIGLQWIKNKYALRTIIRKAHCFTLDDTTSTMVAEFSIAIASDLDSARRLAIPPFPVTWIDYNNVAKLDRMKELGARLTPTARGETSGPPVERAGWLIHPAESEGYYCHYVTLVDQGVIIAPLAYWWHTDVGHPAPAPEAAADELIERLTLGLKNSNCKVVDAFISATPLHIGMPTQGVNYPQHVKDMMLEIAGELRHVWGALIAIGAGHLGAKVTTELQPKHTDVRTMSNGKPLLPLEHKILHLHLGKHTPTKIVTRAITQHKHRWHEVRAHWREIKNPDGTVKKRVPVKSHERGDERIGKITKTYKVER